jgi:uncharacterized phage protein (TIGR01671 family)
MVREIKFRAWDCGEMIFTGSCWAPGVIKPHYTVTVTNEHIMWISQCKNGKYVEVDEGGKTTTYYSEWDDYHFYHPEQIMQYTGLKDKNGKEIYEGDIIRHGVGIFPVSWGDDIAAFECNTRVGSRTLYGYQHDGIEVIGNIYENPELLEDKQ